MKTLFWLLLAVSASPQAPNPDTGQSPEANQPSMELLEFLGSFETIDGEWIDPMSLEEQYESDAKHYSQTQQTPAKPGQRALFAHLYKNLDE